MKTFYFSSPKNWTNSGLGLVVEFRHSQTQIGSQGSAAMKMLFTGSSRSVYSHVGSVVTSPGVIDIIFEQVTGLVDLACMMSAPSCAYGSSFCDASRCAGAQSHMFLSCLPLK